MTATVHMGLEISRPLALSDRERSATSRRRGTSRRSVVRTLPITSDTGSNAGRAECWRAAGIVVTSTIVSFPAYLWRAGDLTGRVEDRHPAVTPMEGKTCRTVGPVAPRRRDSS